MFLNYDSTLYCPIKRTVGGGPTLAIHFLKGLIMCLAGVDYVLCINIMLSYLVVSGIWSTLAYNTESQSFAESVRMLPKSGQ